MNQIEQQISNHRRPTRMNSTEPEHEELHEILSHIPISDIYNFTQKHDQNLSIFLGALEIKIKEYDNNNNKKDSNEYIIKDDEKEEEPTSIYNNHSAINQQYGVDDDLKSQSVQDADDENIFDPSKDPDLLSLKENRKSDKITNNDLLVTTDNNNGQIINNDYYSDSSPSDAPLVTNNVNFKPLDEYQPIAFQSYIEFKNGRNELDGLPDDWRDNNDDDYIDNDNDEYCDEDEEDENISLVRKVAELEEYKQKYEILLIKYKKQKKAATSIYSNQSADDFKSQSVEYPSKDTDLWLLKENIKSDKITNGLLSTTANNNGQTNDDYYSDSSPSDAPLITDNVQFKPLDEYQPIGFQSYIELKDGRNELDGLPDDWRDNNYDDDNIDDDNDEDEEDENISLVRKVAELEKYKQKYEMLLIKYEKKCDECEQLKSELFEREQLKISELICIL